jgi:hypothetical protein
MVPPPGVLLRWGPGTTLNLLKFPIINPTPYRLFRRQERLQKDSQQSEEDLAPGLGLGGRVLDSGVNVSVSQVSATVGGRTRRFADIVLQQGALCLCVRYGGSEEEERARVREEAWRRAVDGAWRAERRRAEEGDAGSRAWSETEKQQLLSLVPKQLLLLLLHHV